VANGKLETRKDCEDFIQGCLFMATGGGGFSNIGMDMLEMTLKQGIPIEWVDAEDIPDDIWSITVYGMGSIAPVSQETLGKIKRAGLVEKPNDNLMGQAVKELENHLGKKIGCIVPAELGASNTPLPLVAGARLGIPVVDGDYAGRAIPEEMQGTPYLYGKNSWPFSTVDKWGDVAIVKRAANAYMLERIGKMLSVAAYGFVTMAATPLPAHEMKDILVKGTLTKCLEIGRAIRNAREEGGDPIEAALTITGGWRLFEGNIIRKEWEDRDGYLYGTVLIEGTGEYRNQELKVWFKNENHVSWLNGKPWVCSPDLLSLVYKDTGEGTINTYIKEGDEVVAVGMKGLEGFRTEFCLNKASGPRHFGFDIDYVPIEELVDRQLMSK